MGLEWFVRADDGKPVGTVAGLGALIDNCDRGSLAHVLKSLLRQNPHLCQDARKLLSVDPRPAAEEELEDIYKRVANETTLNYNTHWYQIVAEIGPLKQRAEAYSAESLPLQAAELYVCIITTAAGWMQIHERAYDSDKHFGSWDDSLWNALLKLGSDAPREKLEEWGKELKDVANECYLREELKSVKAINHLLEGGSVDELSRESSGSRRRQRTI